MQYSSPVSYPCATFYVIAQTTAAQTLAVLQPNQDREAIRSAPALLVITRETTIRYSTSAGMENIGFDSLRILDIIHAEEYVEVSIDGNLLPFQTFFDHFQLSEHIKTNHIRASATLATGTAIIRTLQSWPTISLVHYCFYNKTKNGVLRRTLQYIGRYAEIPAKADEDKLTGQFSNVIS